MDDKDQENNTPSFDELLKCITHPLKLAFLENYPKFLVSRLTAQAIGISDCTPYDWMRGDDLFKQTFQTLKKEITEHLIELHEKNIDDVALNPNTKDQSRIFGSLVRLRAEAPDKYREKPLAIPISADIVVRHLIPRPPYTDTKLLDST